MSGTQERRERLAQLREEARHAGTEAAVERQHARGKLTARERIDLLLDPGSFTELDMFTRHRAHGVRSCAPAPGRYSMIRFE